MSVSDFLSGLGPLARTLIVVFIIVIMFVFFIISRYRKFLTNEFVIHLRNGKVRRAGAGGALFLMPLIDEVMIIPTTIQQTGLEAKEKVVSREYQAISVTGFVFWQVINPTEAFSHVSWHTKSSDYVENVLRNAAESIIRTTCANTPIEDIIRERQLIIDAVIKELHDLMATWGVTVHSVEIRDVEVLDPELRINMEAVKKAAQEEKAKLRTAQMVEITKTRELEVLETTGIREQEANLKIDTKEKERAIKVQELERERIKVEADAARQRTVINAEAKATATKTEAFADADANKAKLLANAEGEAAQIKQSLLAEAEGDAEKIRQALVAEAEGILEQAKSLKETDPRFLQLKLLQSLPEIYKELPIEHMFIIGDNKNAFGSIAGALIPFVQVIKDLMVEQEDVKALDDKVEAK